MSKFKVGMKVKSLENSIDITLGRIYTIIEDGDRVIFLDNHGDRRNRTYSNYEIVEVKTQPLTNTIITNITSPEQHRRVQEKLFGMGHTWFDNSQEIKFTSSTHICVNNTWMSFWGDQSSEDAIKSSKSKTIIPASEFLGEEENPQTCSLDCTYEFKLQPSKSLLYSEGMVERIEELKNYNMPKDEPCVTKGNNKTMENIVSFFNDLTVSAEDKELRKAGLKDENLELTGFTLDIIKDLEAQERGYKNWKDLDDKMINESGGLTSLEVETLYKKFYTKLLETANKFNIKNEKKNK